MPCNTSVMSADLTHKPARYTAVVADDHVLVRNGLKQVLAAVAGVSVVGEAGDGLETVALAKREQPDLLTLDSGLPLVSGMEAYVEVRRWSPATQVVVITGFTAPGQLKEWYEAGVDGLFLKTCPPEEMEIGIEQILNDQVRYCSKMVTDIISGSASASTLSKRERQVLQLLAEGFNNQQIGERLSISPKTVDSHRTKLMAKLDVHSLGQLISYALKQGLLDTQSQL